MGHDPEECHLLKGPKPQIEIYGHVHNDLTFFAMPITDTYRPKTENTRMGMVTVTGGEMTISQVTNQLQRVVPVEHFNWEVIQVGQNVFRVLFPSKAELDRLIIFGTFKVPKSVCELKVDSWLAKCEPLYLLPQVWVRATGIPPRHKGDFFGSMGPWDTVR